MSDDVETLLSYIDGQQGAYVVQKYLERPLLLNGGRKFDIRYVGIQDSKDNRIKKLVLFRENGLDG